MRAQLERKQQYSALVSLPSDTLDGEHISLLINGGLLIDVEQMREAGAEGIGLFRTEIQFMMQPSFPTLEEQTELYTQILQAADGRPVTFRTLDVGCVTLSL